MYMPRAKGFRYIVAARDDLSGAPEGRALRSATAELVSHFIWEELLCRYGALGQIVTDNGPEVQGAVSLLLDRYHIPQMRIAAYNSKANGVVERGHFVIREALIKTCEGNPNNWPDHVPHAFFADKVTTRRQTGFSPFYLLHGVHPVLPFDLSEASFLVEGFTRNMAPEDLLALRIRQLEKRPEDIAQAAKTLERHRLSSKEQFERRFATRLVQEIYPPGTLVLIQNTAIAKSANRKHKPRFIGPYEIDRQLPSGSYVIKELDGTISRQAIAGFRITPYISRNDPRLVQLQHPGDDDASDEEESAQEEHSNDEDIVDDHASSNSESDDE